MKAVFVKAFIKWLISILYFDFGGAWQGRIWVVCAIWDLTSLGGESFTLSPKK